MKGGRKEEGDRADLVLPGEGEGGNKVCLSQMDQRRGRNGEGLIYCAKLTIRRSGKRG